MPNMSDSFSEFIKKLNIPQEVKDMILEAKAAIQDHLRRGLENFSVLPEGGGIRVIPRFFVQGSWAYDLVNMPDQVPPQQVDIDMGVYLPVSYLGTKRPSIAAKEFFAKADFLLQQLANLRGWTIDRSKRTCTRVVLSHNAHFDLPLYSIPNGDFQGLAKAAVRGGFIKEAGAFNDSVVVDHMDLWEELPSDEVLLAMRDGDWKPSDPRKIHNWFKREVARHGDQLRPVCRSVKAWRDRIWRAGGPSSIFLMAAVCRLFRAVPGRLDLALHGVLQGLPGLLQGPVYNPIDKDENLSEHQKPEDLLQLAREAAAFAADLGVAINSADAGGGAHKAIIRHLGLRFPLLAVETGRDLSQILTPIEKAERIRQQNRVQSIAKPYFRD